MQNIEIDDLLRELDECEESEVVSVGAESFLWLSAIGLHVNDHIIGYITCERV